MDGWMHGAVQGTLGVFTTVPSGPVLVLVLFSLVWCFSDCLVLSYDVLVIPGTSWSDGSRPLLPFSVVLDCGGLVLGCGGREVSRCRGVEVVGGVVWMYVYIWLGLQIHSLYERLVRLSGLQAGCEWGESGLGMPSLMVDGGEVWMSIQETERPGYWTSTESSPLPRGVVQNNIMIC